MTLVWVQRSAGIINGVFANQQPGFADEQLDDSDASIVAYLNPPPDPRVTAIRTDANRGALLTKLKNSKPAQIRSYISGLGIADAVAAQAITNILILIALDVRQ